MAALRLNCYCSFGALTLVKEISTGCRIKLNVIFWYYLLDYQFRGALADFVCGRRGDLIGGGRDSKCLVRSFVNTRQTFSDNRMSKVTL